MGARGSRLPFVVAVALAAVKLWLASAKAVAAFDFAGHDQMLFLRLAQAILRTGWLGQFNELTLAKGPGYPLFLAANHLLGAPLLVSQQLLYLGAGAVFVWALGSFVASRWLLAGTFALYAFSPASAMDITDHVLRTAIYPALSVLSLGCGIGLLGAAATGRRSALAWGLGLGAAFGCFWLTREEGVWLLPSIGLLLLGAAWATWRRRGAASIRWRGWVPLAAPLMVFLLLDGGVAALNHAAYGVWTTNQFRYRPFLDAYGALLRVARPVEQPFIPVPAAVRQAIYRESPRFRELRPSLERDWIGAGCEIYPAACHDIAGGWFMWALLSAAAEAGHFRSGPEMGRFFAGLAQEVNDACAERRLACGPPQSGMRPPIHWRRIAPQLLAALRRAYAMVVGLSGLNPGQAPSDSSPAGRALFAAFTHEPVAPEGSPTHRTADAGIVARVSGWVYFPDHRAFTVGLRTGLVPLPLGAAYSERPDVAARLHDPAAHRLGFDVAGFCPAPCFLVVDAGGAPFRILVAPGETGARPLGGEGTVFLDSAAEVPRPAAGSAPAMAQGWRPRLLAGIARAYRTAAPVLFVCGLGAYLALAVLVCRGAGPWLFLIGTALALGIVALTSAIALVEVTSFPAVGFGYLAPGVPLALLFGPVCLLGLHEWRRERAKRAMPLSGG